MSEQSFHFGPSVCLYTYHTWKSEDGLYVNVKLHFFFKIVSQTLKGSAVHFAHQAFEHFWKNQDIIYQNLKVILCRGWAA